MAQRPRGAPAGVEKTVLESLLGGLWGGWAQPLQELLKVTGVSGVRPSRTFPAAFCSPGPCVDGQGPLSQDSLSQDPAQRAGPPTTNAGSEGSYKGRQRKQEEAGRQAGDEDKGLF